MRKAVAEEFQKKFAGIYMTVSEGDVFLCSERRLEIKEYCQTFEALLDFFFLNTLFTHKDIWFKSPGQHTILFFPRQKLKT